MRARVNANGVRLYEFNSTISPAKGFLANGEEIEIKAEYGGWCQLMDGRWVEACYTEAIEVGGGGASSWNDLEDKPFSVNYTQKRIAESEERASSSIVAAPTPPLGYRGDDRKIHFHDDHVINVFINGTLYKSGTVKENADGKLRIITEDGEELTNQDFRIDTKDTKLYLGTIRFSPSPLTEDATITVTYEYDREIKTLDPMFLPEGMSGDVSWNDLTDKPFGEGEPVETVLIEDSFVADYYAPSTFGSFVVGQPYYVVYDGIDCGEQIAKDGGSWGVYIGLHPQTGEGNPEATPFCFGTQAGEDGLMYVGAIGMGDNQHTFKISAMIQEIHTLDEKYIPAMSAYATKDYVNEMLGVIENGSY